MSERRPALAGLALISVGGLLSACSGSAHARNANVGPRPVGAARGSAVTQSCRSLGAASLSSAVGRSVAVDPAHSVPGVAQPGQVRAFTCAFVPSGGGQEVGTLSWERMVSVAAARAAYDKGKASSSLLGIPVTPERIGDAAYAMPAPGGAWSCAVLQSHSVATATVRASGSGPACAWAERGLATFH